MGIPTDEQLDACPIIVVNRITELEAEVARLEGELEQIAEPHDIITTSAATVVRYCGCAIGHCHCGFAPPPRSER